MKTLSILFTYFFSAIALGQGSLIDRAGVITFFSEAPLENIEAINRQVVGAIDIEKGNLAVTMRMDGFQFRKSLMQEHFNENYVESEEFPKASFKGSLSGFEASQLKGEGTFQKEAIGEITIHGVTKPLKAIINFKILGSKIQVNTVFKLRVDEFDIEIPTVVFYNIAEEVEVKCQFVFNNTKG